MVVLVCELLPVSVVMSPVVLLLVILFTKLAGILNLLCSLFICFVL